jgi:hypothetical protein
MGSRQTSYRGKTRALILVCVAALLAAPAVALPPTLSNLAITDVTPSGFSAVWEVSEPAEASIGIFSDAAGTNEITSSFEVTVQPLRGGNPSIVDPIAAEAARNALRSASEAKGLARVSVENALPATTYYIRVRSTAGIETAEYPAGAPISVTTENVNSFLVRSQLLRVQFSEPDPTGWIVTAESADTGHPVSAVVGDGAGAQEAFLNLGQMFDMADSNWEPVGLTSLTITVREGGGTSSSPSFDIDFIDGFDVGLTYLVDFDTGSSTDDTDGDGLYDEFELANGFDPLVPGEQGMDPDADGLDNLGEQTFGTDPHVPDTDGDGSKDGAEIAAGTDPLDDQDFPIVPVPLLPGVGLVLLTCALLLSGMRVVRRAESRLG